VLSVPAAFTQSFQVFTAEVRSYYIYSFCILNFLERDGNRDPWPASVILIGLIGWIGSLFVTVIAEKQTITDTQDGEKRNNKRT